MTFGMLPQSQSETLHDTSMLLGEILETLGQTPADPACTLSGALEQIRLALGADQAVLVLHPEGPERTAGYVGYGNRNTTPLRAAQLSTVTSLSFVREMLKAENPRLESVELRDPSSASASALHIRHLIGAPVLDLVQPVHARHSCGVLVADRRDPNRPFDESALSEIGSYALGLAALLKALADLRRVLAPADRQLLELLRAKLIENKGNLSLSSAQVGLSEYRARKLLAEGGLKYWHDDLCERWELSVEAFEVHLRQCGDLCLLAEHFDRDYEQINDFFRHKLRKTLKDYVIALGYDWATIRGPELVRAQRRLATG